MHSCFLSEKPRARLILNLGARYGDRVVLWYPSDPKTNSGIVEWNNGGSVIADVPYNWAKGYLRKYTIGHTVYAGLEV
jgi:hypothetical protein